MKLALRVLAFIAKEIRVIVVQPQLLLLLVVGPFLVLLAFGLGFRPQGPDLEAIVVQQEPGEARQAIGSYLRAVGPPLRVVAITSNKDWALAELQARKVELVILVPANMRATLLAGQQIHLAFYHNDIDPSRIGYITAVVDGATSQLNKAIVQQTVGEQQASAADYEQILTGLQVTLGELRTAVQRNDRARAQQLVQAVRLGAGLVASLWLFAEPMGQGQNPAATLIQQTQELDALLISPQTSPEDLDEAVARMQAATGHILEVLRRARQVSPDVFVAPVAYDVKAISPYLPGYVAYHSPTVLALLVQHLCITLAALSLVDERTAGAIELFRTAPVAAGEILAGKFLAYLFVVALTSTGLVVLLVQVLRVPLLGDPGWLVMVLIALIAYSLNLGFLISAVAHSRSQAIQMSMLVLLGSIFFSGFFVPVDDFVLPVRAISYSLPVTYGIVELRQVALRGDPPEPLFLAIMGVWAIVLCLATVRLFQRQFLTR